MNSSVPENVTVILSPRSAQVTVHAIRFWAYLFSDIISLSFTLFALYHLLKDRALRRALHNHVIIVLLFVVLIFESTNIPWILSNDHNNTPVIKSRVFYEIWTYINYGFYSVQLELFAWATIERHILIFHDPWVSTSKKRFFIHYLPIAAIIIYYIIYMAMIHFEIFCTSSFDAFLAGGIHIPCVFAHTVLGLWDISFHQVLPTLTIVVFSVGLLVRAIRQKNRLRQSIDWRKHRKMIVQLLSISIIYTIFNGPWVMVIFTYQFGLPDHIAEIALVYTGFLYYYVTFLFPLVCCLSSPELRAKMKELLFCWRPAQQVNPTTMATGRSLAPATAAPQ